MTELDTGPSRAGRPRMARAVFFTRPLLVTFGDGAEVVQEPVRQPSGDRKPD